MPALPDLPPRVFTEAQRHRVLNPVYEAPEDLPPITAQRLRELAAAIQDYDGEHLVVTDRLGHVRLRASGPIADPWTIALPGHAAEYRDGLFLHNHLVDSFSHRDVASAITRNMYEMQATEVDGGRLFRLQRPAEGWPRMSRAQVYNAYAQSLADVRSVRQPTRLDDAPGLQAWLRNAQHWTTEVLADRLGLRYSSK
jgi:hypothetical protein